MEFNFKLSTSGDCSLNLKLYCYREWWQLCQPEEQVYCLKSFTFGCKKTNASAIQFSYWFIYRHRQNKSWHNFPKFQPCVLMQSEIKYKYLTVNFIYSNQNTCFKKTFLYLYSLILKFTACFIYISRVKKKLT